MVQLAQIRTAAALGVAALVPYLVPGAHGVALGALLGGVVALSCLGRRETQSKEELAASASSSDRQRTEQLLGALSDELGQARRSAALAESWGRLMMESIPASLAYIDTRERFRFANIRFIERFNPFQRAIEGAELEDMLDPLACEPIREVLRAAREGEIVRTELCLAAAGALRQIKVSCSPDFDAAFELRGFLLLLEDAPKLLACEPLRAAEEAERLASFRSDLLAGMSHGIRTPLTSIIGYAEAMLAEQLGEDERTLALGTILRNGNHLLGVVGDILDLSKIQSGKLDLEIRPVELSELIADVEKHMHSKAAEKGLTFGFEMSFPVPRMIETDPARLKQILTNLLGSAIEFTAVGGVKVNVSFDAAGGKIAFAVVDTGVGIPRAEQHRLFEMPPLTGRRGGGTGLGLVLARALTRKLGGEIVVKSTPGRGSVFTASVAAGQAAKESLVEAIWESRQARPALPKAVAVPRLAGTVLVAEDGPDSRIYLAFLLRKANLEYVMVENGRQAVEEACRRSFDIVLMDMQMPEMDGYEATRLLRSGGYSRPIIAITANNLQGDIDRSTRAGCTDFIAKPFCRDDFFLKISRALTEVERVAPSDQAMLAELDPEIEELSACFLANLGSRMALIRNALQDQKWDDLRMEAHKLRGAAGNYGFPEMGDVAGRLEMASNNADASAAGDALAALEGSIARAVMAGPSGSVVEN